MERPHYYGHRKRLRERFLKNGLTGFAEHEVVELLLTLAIPRADVKQPAKALSGSSYPDPQRGCAENRIRRSRS